jgi:glycosyltransferase involved in cell wall biosynthesis
VIINGYTQRAYLQGLLAAHRARVPTALRLDSIAPFRGEERPARDLAKRLLYSAVLWHAFDLFLGVGSLTLDFLRQAGIPEERTGLFPYSIDVDDFRQRSRLLPEERRELRHKLLSPGSAESGEPIVLSLAKFGEREAPWDLLRAFAQETGTARPNVERDSASPERPWLILAGDGPLRPYLEAFAHDRGIDRVRFPGYIPYPELPALYAACDLFVHPAREERWGVSVAEALACGLPVVTSSRVGAAHDLIRPGANGFTYEAGDAIDLARRIEDALALPRMGVEAESTTILARWDYTAAWRAILNATDRALQRR